MLAWSKKPRGKTAVEDEEELIALKEPLALYGGWPENDVTTPCMLSVLFVFVQGERNKSENTRGKLIVFYILSCHSITLFL